MKMWSLRVCEFDFGGKKVFLRTVLEHIVTASFNLVITLLSAMNCCMVTTDIAHTVFLAFSLVAGKTRGNCSTCRNIVEQFQKASIFIHLQVFIE